MRLTLTALTAALVVVSLSSIGCSAEVTEDVADDSIAAADSSEEGLTGSQPVGTELVTTAAVMSACKSGGVWPFAHFNRLHVAPPLVISEDDLRSGLAVIDAALDVSDRLVGG